MTFQFQEIIGVMVQEAYISIPVMLIFLAAQLFFFIKASSVGIKLVPSIILFVVIIFAVYEGTLTGIAAAFAFALLISCIAIPGFIGVLVAWIIYKIISSKPI